MTFLPKATGQHVFKHDHDEMLEHLRDEWGTAGLIAKAIAPVPPDQTAEILTAVFNHSDETS